MRVAPDLVQLEFGRAWIDTGDRDAVVRVQCGKDFYAAMETHCGGVFERSPSGVEVLALRGRIVLHLESDTVALAPSEAVVVDGLGAGKKTKVPFTAPATSWMTHMIQMSTDPDELANRVRSVVDAFDDPELRDAARVEIMKLGSQCVWALADSAERALARDRDHALRAADLVAQILEYRSSVYALPLLMTEDPELRVIAFHGLRRATGMDIENESFWRDAERDRRSRAVERWKNALTR
jgi:hypothetical protein